MSTVMMGGANCSRAATASATMSAPTWLCTARRMSSPVLMPGPTVMGGFPKRRFKAASAAIFSGGTTLHKMASRASWARKP